MRRTEIIDGVNQVLNAIRRTRIEELLMEHIDALRQGNKQTKSGINVELLSALQEWLVLYQQFSPSADHITDALKLGRLADPDTVASLLGALEEAYPISTLLYSSITFASQHLPKLLTLLNNASTSDEKISVISDGRSHELAKFSVIIVDDSDGFVTPSRMVAVIESTEKLYEVCATLNGSSETQLRIVAADAGSDILLTFLGNSTVVACLLKLFTTIYQAVAFFPEAKRTERAKAIAQQLPVIAQIAEMEAEEKISHELAERLRYDLGVGVDRHVSAHAYVPEASSNGILSVRALMAPETKLLTGSTDSEVSDEDEQKSVAETTDRTQKPVSGKTRSGQGKQSDPSANNTENGLSPEEQQQYEELAAKIQSRAKRRGSIEVEEVEEPVIKMGGQR